VVYQKNTIYPKVLAPWGQWEDRFSQFEPEFYRNQDGVFCMKRLILPKSQGPSYFDFSNQVVNQVTNQVTKSGYET